MPEKTVMDLALTYLSRQAYCRTKLLSKLERSGFSKEEILECLNRLGSWGYLDDWRFGANRVQTLISKFKSRRYIEVNLIKTGLDPTMVRELLGEFYPEKLELDIAKKYLLSKKSSSPREKIKELAGLARAGFAEETIRKCFPEETL